MGSICETTNKNQVKGPNGGTVSLLHTKPQSGLKFPRLGWGGGSATPRHIASFWFQPVNNNTITTQLKTFHMFINILFIVKGYLSLKALVEI